MIYLLKDTIELPISLAQAWAFFSNPQNLSVITPPELGFKITSEVASEIYAGQIITYTVSPIFGIPMEWVTEITYLENQRYFVDEQRIGPYRMWHHQHRFKEGPGGTMVEDIVHYAMPYGMLGKMIHALVVRKQLQGIFKYRKQVLQSMFSDIK